MAVNRDPILKRCRSLDIDPSHLGIFKESKRTSNRRQRKMSEYGIQLREKQRAKFIYGMQEKPFRNLFDKAAKKSGATGENLLIMLESRLDNVVYRMGFAMTRREARQLVVHGHYTLNGKKVNSPGQLVKPGDVVAVCQKSQASVKFKGLLEEYGKKSVPQWIEKQPETFEGKIVAMPAREDIDYEVSENLIVELYSR